MGKLFGEALLKFVMGMALVGILLFLPAGTWNFPNGWLLMALLFIPMFVAGLVMLFKNPDLLRKRLQAKEKQREQDLVVKLSGLMFLLGFVVAGLTVRFDWYKFPQEVCIVGAVVFILAYLLYAEVLRENAYLSRTIEVQEGQRVIDTGLYCLVRHPMYAATVFLFLSIPLVLGSLYAFVIFLAYPFILVKRIKNEEKFLAEQLSGYSDYQAKVKYRLIPFVW